MRRTVDIRWVRRTLARVRWLADRVDAEELANVLVAHGGAQRDNVQYLHDYLGEVHEYLTRVRPEPKCTVCGIERVGPRPDARYCSPRCRQRAYLARRTRVTGRPTGRTANSSSRDTLPDLSTMKPVTSPGGP